MYAATEGGAVSETEDAGAFYDAEEDSLTIEYRTQTIKCENAAIKSEDVTYLQWFFDTLASSKVFCN